MKATKSEARKMKKFGLTLQEVRSAKKNNFKASQQKVEAENIAKKAKSEADRLEADRLEAEKVEADRLAKIEADRLDSFLASPKFSLKVTFLKEKITDTYYWRRGKEDIGKKTTFHYEIEVKSDFISFKKEIKIAKDSELVKAISKTFDGSILEGIKITLPNTLYTTKSIAIYIAKSNSYGRTINHVFQLKNTFTLGEWFDYKTVSQIKDRKWYNTIELAIENSLDCTDAEQYRYGVNQRTPIVSKNGECIY